MASLDRNEQLARLQDRFDVLVIGGGATGLGVAVDAATRGYRTALIEARDFGSGTSSRSTKLIHGGVRYLAQGRIGLVREALQERARLRSNAPHLVKELPIILPSYSWHSLPAYAAGLKIYDALAGRSGFKPSRLLSKAEIAERLPGINRDGLQGGILYHDGQFDDARLAITLAQTAFDHGAVVCNYVRAARFIHAGGRIAGVEAADVEGGSTVAIQARVVINAGGTASDEVRQMDESNARRAVIHSQGSHIVLPAALLGERHALLVPRTEDNRVIFATPWLGRLLVGTTDLEVANPEPDPTPTRAEVEYLLEHVNRYLATAADEAAISSAFAGIRPLVRGRKTATSAVSREHHVEVSRSGLISITGGKWTTYRKMAEDTLDAAIATGRLNPQPCATRELRLRAATEKSPVHGIFEPYGTDAAVVQGLMDADRSLATPIHSRLPYLWVQALYAVRHEMARTVEDVLARRTRGLFLDAEASLLAAPRAASILARELNRPRSWEIGEVDSFRQKVASTMACTRPPASSQE